NNTNSMSKIFVLIIENEKILFGSLHWRELLKPDFKSKLKCMDVDGGVIFYDKPSGLFLNLQDCVNLDRTFF
ncbi:hypothetical protein KY329_02900, partial [Candidatus Woesearchaeota archaeon]|nr:hypothetical protein [Candidatus Woesearchaeota archaeon]